MQRPASASQRLAMYIVRAHVADYDVKTLTDWASEIGVSASALKELCRIVGVKPRDARDFARALRAVVRSHSEECDPDLLLDVSDRRTLSQFKQKAGPHFRRPSLPFGVDDFIDCQQFVPSTASAARLLGECSKLSRALAMSSESTPGVPSK